MKLGIFSVLLMLIMFAPDALPNRQNPGSCLLFPYYDTTGSTMTIHTITNVGTETVVVRVVFVNGQTCEPMSTKIALTAGDTFTFGAHGLVTQPETGFVYAYVVEHYFSNLEKKANVLIGDVLVLGYWDKKLVSFSLNAVSFQALDLVKDEKLRLDGKEYTCAPKTVYFPRFFGQDSAFYSRLILINLTGGQWFKVEVEFLFYNDNEQVFDSFYSFDCFEIVKLSSFSPPNKAFLLATNHDLSEPWPFPGLAETGTMRITGDYAYNNTVGKKIQDASIYAVLIEGVTSLGYTAANLPMQIEAPNIYKHAMLWSTDPSGN